MVARNQRAVWVEAARQAGETGRVDVLCPANGDAILRATWIPASDDGRGEYRLWCPRCGAENYLLKRYNVDE